MALWFWSADAEQTLFTDTPADSSAKPPDGTASAPPNPFWDLAAQASARADAAEAAEPLDLLRWESDWCQQNRKLPASQPWDQLLIRVQGLQPVSDAIVTQWLQALRRVGTPRALALADWREASPASRANLRGLAERSDDPFVISLGLQRACDDQACRSQLARRWRAVEPHNLQAHLSALSYDSTANADLLLEGMARAQISSSYRSEALAMLMDAGKLPSAGPLALMREVDAIGRGAAWAAPPTPG